MAIIEDRLSTTPVSNDWISPDDLDRAWLEDYEAGPVALNDTSEGLFYQSWHLTYNALTGDFVATPLTAGAAQTVLSGIFNVENCTFTFDQNGHVTIAYTQSGQAKLYWYDTLAADWVTTDLEAGVKYAEEAG